MDGLSPCSLNSLKNLLHDQIALPEHSKLSWMRDCKDSKHKRTKYGQKQKKYNEYKSIRTELGFTNAFFKEIFGSNFVSRR
jgi:hypothetical protein